MYTKKQIRLAIDAEAEGWATFFGSNDLEGRRNVMRANVAVGYLEPLLPYLERMPKRKAPDVAKRQARFWVDYNGGAVRLKINPGQVVRVAWGGKNDAGHWLMVETYSFDGAIVSTCCETNAYDRDGRHQRVNYSECSYSNLSAGWRDIDTGVTFPHWGPRLHLRNGQSSQSRLAG